MAETTFRSRANAVRAESRMLMQRLKAERLASSRHRAARPSATEAPLRELAPAVHPTATTILPSRKVQAAVGPSTAEAPAAPEEKSPESEAPAPVVEQAPAPVEAAAVKVSKRKAKATNPKRKPAPALHAEVAALASAEAFAQAETEKAELEQRGPVKKHADSRPLSAIPTLGPGMIWRLNQIGLMNAGDLAHVDPERLRASLGGVAKLIRVENLIELARSSDS